MLTRRLVVTSGLALAACGSRSLAQQAQANVLEMTSPRACHGMVALKDGSVLMLGGCSQRSCDTGPSDNTVDRFDPVTGKISFAGRMRRPWLQAGTSVVPDGRVLLTGGWSDGRLNDTIELFDPRTGTSQDAGRMSAVQGCIAMAVSDRRVLLIGEKTVDAFDPVTLKTTQVSASSVYMDSSTVTRLNDGRILIAGGNVKGPARADAFLLDPATGKADRTGSLLAPRRKHAAVKLNDGRVLIVGGAGERDRQNKYRAMELYDPATRRFSSVGDLQVARFKIPDAAVRLSDGRVLVTSGADKPEIIDPATWRSREIDVSLGDMLNFTTAMALANGDVLVAGGYSERNINPTSRAWLIRKAAFA